MRGDYGNQFKVNPLGQIRNEHGFKFIGIDKTGGRHHCTVRRGDSGSFYMHSNTVQFHDLVGWVPAGERT